MGTENRPFARDVEDETPLQDVDLEPKDQQTEKVRGGALPPSEVHVAILPPDGTPTAYVPPVG